MFFVFFSESRPSQLYYQSFQFLSLVLGEISEMSRMSVRDSFQICYTMSRLFPRTLLRHTPLFLFVRATTNNKVREQVLLELSYVNSDLQILKEELEGLNISVEVYQNTE